MIKNQNQIDMNYTNDLDIIGNKDIIGSPRKKEVQDEYKELFQPHHVEHLYGLNDSNLEVIIIQHNSDDTKEEFWLINTSNGRKMNFYQDDLQAMEVIHFMTP